jgi:RNA polymerase sigma-70 factor (ECF subfamily)
MERFEASDEELVNRCLSGEKDAFSVLVSRYEKLVYNIVYNLMGSTSEASDLFQESFLKIYKSLSRYNPAYRFATWSMRITTRVCLDKLRQKRPDHHDLDDIEEIHDDRSSPEEQCVEREKAQAVKKAVDELPEDYRAVIVLFHQQGLSYEDLVGVLGLPMTIIKNRLYRARLILREKLSVYEEGEASSW